MDGEVAFVRFLDIEDEGLLVFVLLAPLFLIQVPPSELVIGSAPVGFYLALLSYGLELVLSLLFLPLVLKH